MCSPSTHPRSRVFKYQNTAKRNQEKTHAHENFSLNLNAFVFQYLHRRRTWILTPLSLSCLLALPFSVDRRSLPHFSLDLGVTEGDIVTEPPLLCSIQTKTKNSKLLDYHNKPRRTKSQNPSNSSTKTQDSQTLIHSIKLQFQQQTPTLLNQNSFYNSKIKIDHEKENKFKEQRTC